MRVVPNPEGRCSERKPLQSPASVVVNLDRNPMRIPCLVLDLTTEGFRLRGNFQVRRGQVIEVILEHQPLISLRSRVVWVGKAGSKQQGEVGLEIV
jgi:hypothetical protein